MTLRFFRAVESTALALLYCCSAVAAEPERESTHEPPPNAAASSAQNTADSVELPQAPSEPAAPSWLARAGYGLRGLRFALGANGTKTEYSTNQNQIFTGALAYEGWAISGSFTFGNAEPVSTHGRSRGFSVFAAHPVKVANRELLLSVVAQRYRGMYRYDSEVGGANPPVLAIEDDLRSHFYELAAGYHLNPEFSFRANVHRRQEQRILHSALLGVSLSFSGVENTRPLVPDDSAEDYGQEAGMEALRAWTLSLPFGGRMQVVEPSHWYLSLGGHFGPSGSYVVLSGAQNDGLRVGAAVGVDLAAGYATDTFQAGFWVDVHGHGHALSSSQAILLSGVGAFELGLRF